MGLIVNADDFGKSIEVNRAITECFNKGYIHRTTIMVNMPYAVEAFEIAEKNGFTHKVGLHINLTEGRPLTEDIAKNPDFCDENGVFNAAFYHDTKKRLVMDDKSVEDVYKEIKAQYEKYEELGFSLAHIDSHHHVHTNLPIFRAIEKLSKEKKFSSIRLSRNLYKGGSLFNRVYKLYFNAKVKKYCDHTGNYFGSFVDAADYFSVNGKEESTSKKFKDFCEKNELEIMVHPMYTEDGQLVDTDILFEKEMLLYEDR